jgi:predicted DNA-binding transcriptional regulator YafY
LIRAVLTREGADAYGEVEGQSLHRRLENDLQRIRDRLLIDLYFDRRVGGYVLQNIWQPLLDLPEEDLETIAWLQQTFDYDAPKHDEVHALLDRLRFYLGPERAVRIEQARITLEMSLKQRDEDEIAPGVRGALTKAYVSRRQVELLYLSPQYEDGIPRRHVVEPYHSYYFDTRRGHYYLRAYCRQMEGPEGIEYPYTYFTYRLGRIQEVQILPKKLSPLKPTPPRYEVVYELAPQIARLGISRHREIEVHEVERREDGSAVVRGETDSIFWATQALLHYGANCRVLGGPEIVREMRQVVEEMAAVYGLEDHESVG